jgi:hypothetical protein
MKKLLILPLLLLFFSCKSDAELNIEIDFYFDKNLIKDRQTNSVWDYTGYSVSGPMKGKKLELLVGIQHFWFSAAAFFP